MNPSEIYFMLQDNLRQMSETLEGEVTHLKENGWTDEQSRAIVASSLGWRPSGGEA